MAWGFVVALPPAAAAQLYVRKHESMSVSQFRRRFLVGATLCGVLALFIGQFTAFEPHWRGVKDGMTQTQVRQALGSPDWIGTSACIGSGGKAVIRWDYRRSSPLGCVHHFVDFDHIGVEGAPVVFRTESFREEWEWWWPWRARARA